TSFNDTTSRLNTRMTTLKHKSALSTVTSIQQNVSWNHGRMLRTRTSALVSNLKESPQRLTKVLSTHGTMKTQLSKCASCMTSLQSAETSLMIRTTRTRTSLLRSTSTHKTS